ncbi:TPR-like protein [Imleria badia]|nr:TPR-like protein [Imleria badia]
MPTCLNNLSNAFLSRFERLGELSDLEDAISRYRGAADLTPHGHPDELGLLNNLSRAFLARFERLGELSDLEDAILRQRDTVDLTPHGHPDKPERLNNLGNVFLSRFRHLGEISDLEDAILRYRDAVDITPHGHPDRPGRLNNLGNALLTLFEHLGELSDLEDAISGYRDAVELTPHGHPHMPTCLNNLGGAFLTRFEHLGEASDLEDAISSLRGAVDLTPYGHPDKLARLNNLGKAFIIRFERLGELSDLEDAILRYRDAVDLTPPGHPNKPGRLSNLGNALLARFKRLREVSDLENAILRQRDAVDSTPHGHSDRPGRLNNLGNAFLTRFERLGELSDLEDAISSYRDAVDTTPHGHPNKPGRINNLGNAFLTRFERFGELCDLEEAISRYREAVDLIPHGHPVKPTFLNNLGNAFLSHFERLREVSDLEDAILRHKGAVDLTPHGHPDQPQRLNNLGSAFLTRFERLGELSDLEEAISMHKEAVELTPHGHPSKPTHFYNLGQSFKTRFDRLGEMGDLGHAISTLRNAVDLTPRGHPDAPTILNDLGHCFAAHFDRSGDVSNLEQAISLYLHAASTSTGPSMARFLASQNWISCARRICHHSLLCAYSVAIALLPELAWIGLPLSYRYFQLGQGADVVREAAAAALDSGLPETAVEWLEQGRSVVWGELFQLRSSYEELSAAHPDHARRLRELSAALGRTSVAGEKSSAFAEQTSSTTRRAADSSQQATDKHRVLAIERDKLLREIRTFPGFEQFLFRKEFSQLRTSAHSGPVVILNAAESRCDALIVLADLDHVIHVPLPTFTLQISTGLQNMLEKLLGLDRVVHSDDGEGESATLPGVSWESILSTLWNGVVKPVLDALAFSTPGALSRIFWCPTGPFVFLPIHAAGLYGTHHSQPGCKVSDFVVSSYLPTLSILSLSRNVAVAPEGDLSLLAVRQPPSDGQSRLPGVDAELEHIKAVIKNSPSVRTTLVESSVGTVEEVLSLMKQADWVHFACHGIQDAASMTESGLCLADQRRLKISDFVTLSRPHGGLAFLSACQTAMGDEHLSDEAIHIAAGMLFAGYGGVIGTMWSISDELAPEVARDVYAQLFRNDTRPDYREAARALHDAIMRLRESGEASFVTWLPFIHVGL